MLSPEAKERFRLDPARAIEYEVKAFVLGIPARIENKQGS
jgi:hypothetical protein